jgi:aldehyde dehydrogenase (NAD+)
VIDKVYIGGEPVTPHGTALFDLFRSATGKVIGPVRLADEVDVNSAVAAAKRALLATAVAGTDRSLEDAVVGR